MADYNGAKLLGISNQAGLAGNRHTLDGVSSTAYTREVFSQVPLGANIPTTLIGGTLNETGDSLIRRTPILTENAAITEGPGLNWFEKIHSYPTLIELGNLLSTVVRDIEIYNSYRDTVQTLDTATNNAGTGITFQGLPGLPATLTPNGGQIFQVQISTQGQPSIDGTLDFTTSVYPVSVAITGSRVVMMAYEPEGMISEKLEFLTDILRSANGKEQRIRVRNFPRQIIDYSFKIPDGEERRRFETFLYKWHPQTFGVPIWFESQRLTAAATAGSTTINLSTSYSDFREGSLVIVWSDYLTFDALEIDTITPTSITLSSPLTRNYPIRTKVMPLRTAITKQEITGDKYTVNLATYAVKFRITDNEVDIADDSAFNSHNGKTMFDDPNWISRETITDTLKNLLHKIDNNIGSPIQFSDWVNSHFITSKGFFCKNSQDLWEMRQMLHALAGRQKSFYLPTFYKDLVVVNDLTTGSDILDVENTGYADFIDGNEPNKSLYIVLINGTIIKRQVESSSVIDSTTERLVLDSTWSTDISVAEVDHISFLRLGRFSNDSFNINHNNSGQATMRSTVQGVIQ